MNYSSLQTYKKNIMLSSIITLSVFIPFSQFIHELPYTYQLLPFFISMVFLGLPHGALDHLVPNMLSNTSLKHSILPVVALYILVGGMYLFWWFLSPLSALFFFILLTWLHWGQGDLYALTKLRKPRYSKTVFDKILAVLVRGGIPMLVPLIAYPNFYEQFFASVLSLFTQSTSIDFLFTSPARMYAFAAILSITILSAVTAFVKSYKHNSLDSWVYDQFEVLFLWVYFFMLPPIFAIGLYFSLWHSLRHVARLSLIDTRVMKKYIQDKKYIKYVQSFVSKAAPLTIVALIGFAAFTLVLPTTIQSAQSLIALYLVTISILTLPHFIVVSWMDYKEHIWY